MKLKHISIIAISSTFLVFLIFVSLIVRFSLSNTFIKIENSIIENSLITIKKDLEDSSSSLNRLLGDWTAWDDTEDYVLGEYPDYIADNMMNETFTNLKLNFIWIGDINARTLYSKFFDLNTAEEIQFPNSILNYLNGNTVLGERTKNKIPIYGVIIINNLPYIIASQPVTDSFGDSDPAGTMVMGILINKKWMDDHSEKLNIFFKLYNFEAENFGAIEEEALFRLTEGEEYTVSFVNNDKFYGYSSIKDIEDKPALLVRIDGQRTIFNAGRKSLNLFMGAMLLLMILLGLTLRFSIGQFVIRRLKYIEVLISQFESGNSTIPRLIIKGNDEISHLMTRVNEMFIRIKKSEKEILRAKIIAESSNNAKSEFLRNMSHELRTPLNHIIGFSQLMKDEIPGTINDTQKEYLDDVLSSSSHLLSLINNLLDLSKIESGREKLNAEQINLTEILNHTIGIFETKEINNQLNYILKPSIPSVSINADKLKLTQILYNLLSNAVKFSSNNGTITVSADTASHDNELVISVKDTGVGLKADSMELIFESFGQVDSEINRHTEGTGLGLALTKHLVELHGGNIWVESEGLGMGSTFSFTLPIDVTD